MMLSLTALAASGAGVGRNSRARARSASSAAISRTTRLSARCTQGVQPKPMLRPISAAPAMARIRVVSSSRRRRPGASGIWPAGKAAIIRSAISEGKARPITTAATRLALAGTAAGACSDGHSRRASRPMTTMARVSTAAWPWRAKGPGPQPQTTANRLGGPGSISPASRAASTRRRHSREEVSRPAAIKALRDKRTPTSAVSPSPPTRNSVARPLSLLRLWIGRAARPSISTKRAA